MDEARRRDAERRRQELAQQEQQRIEAQLRQTAACQANLDSTRDRYNFCGCGQKMSVGSGTTCKMCQTKESAARRAEQQREMNRAEQQREEAEGRRAQQQREESERRRAELRDVVRGLPTQDHHVASNKAGNDKERLNVWTDMARTVAGRFGLDLDDDWNRVKIPHRGAHSSWYHAYVVGTMQAIEEQVREEQATVKKLRSEAAAAERFKELFDEMITTPLRHEPEALRAAYYK